MLKSICLLCFLQSFFLHHEMYLSDGCCFVSWNLLSSLFDFFMEIYCLLPPLTFLLALKFTSKYGDDIIRKEGQFDGSKVWSSDHGHVSLGFPCANFIQALESSLQFERTINLHDFFQNIYSQEDSRVRIKFLFELKEQVTFHYTQSSRVSSESKANPICS